MQSHGLKWGMGHPPQLLARRVQGCQAHSLRVRHAELAQRRGVCWTAAAIHVQVGHAAGDPEDLDHAAVLGGNPGHLAAIVTPRIAIREIRDVPKEVEIMDSLHKQGGGQV